MYLQIPMYANMHMFVGVGIVRRVKLLYFNLQSASRCLFVCLCVSSTTVARSTYINARELLLGINDFDDRQNIYRIYIRI